MITNNKPYIENIILSRYEPIILRIKGWAQSTKIYINISQHESKHNRKTQVCLYFNKGLENRCNYCYRIISLCHPIIIFHFVCNRLLAGLLDVAAGF